MTPSVVGFVATYVGVRPSSFNACTGFGPRVNVDVRVSAM